VISTSRAVPGRVRGTVGATFLMMNASIGGAFAFTVTSGTAHFQVETSTYLLALTFWLVAGAVSMPFIGRLVSRFGVRRVSLPCGLVCAACLTGMALAPNVETFFVCSALIGVPWSGCAVMPSTTLTTGWWDGHPHRGLAVGIVAASAGVGGVLWGFLTPYAIALGGYRLGMLSLAASVLLLVVVGGLVCVVDPPRATDPADASGRAAPPPRARVDLRAVGPIAVGALFAGSAVVLSVILGTILEHSGLDSSLIPLAFAINSVGVIVVGPLLGAAHDRLGFGWMLGIIAIVEVAVIPFIVILPYLAPLLLLVVLPLSTLALNFAPTVLPLAVSRVVPSASYAANYGIVSSGLTSGTAIGAPLWGLVLDRSGSYDLAIWLSIPLGLASFAIVGAAVRRAGRRAAAP